MLKYILTIAAIVIVATATIWFALPPKARENGRLQDPPPKPPNCEAKAKDLYSEIANGLPDDIRIIRVGETRMFVPAKWIEHYFVDSRSKRSDGYSYDILEMFSPDLHDKECPGVEHILVAEGQTPRFGRNRGDVVSFVLRGNFAPKFVNGSDRMQGFSVGVQATKRPDGKIRTFPRYSSTGNYWVQPTPDLFLTKVGRYSDDVESYETELRKLGIWLTTHPEHRENSPIFFPSSEF